MLFIGEGRVSWDCSESYSSENNLYVALISVRNLYEGETLVFNDSITSPKLIRSILISYAPSWLNVQLKLVTLHKSPS